MVGQDTNFMSRTTTKTDTKMAVLVLSVLTVLACVPLATMGSVIIWQPFFIMVPAVSTVLALICTCIMLCLRVIEHRQKMLELLALGYACLAVNFLIQCIIFSNFGGQQGGWSWLTLNQEDWLFLDTTLSRLWHGIFPLALIAAVYYDTNLRPAGPGRSAQLISHKSPLPASSMEDTMPRLGIVSQSLDEAMQASKQTFYKKKSSITPPVSPQSGWLGKIISVLGPAGSSSELVNVSRSFFVFLVLGVLCATMVKTDYQSILLIGHNSILDRLITYVVISISLLSMLFLYTRTRLNTTFYLWMFVSNYAFLLALATVINARQPSYVSWYMAKILEMMSLGVFMTALLSEMRAVYIYLFEASAHLQTVASHDELTGVYNRYYLENTIRDVIDSHRRKTKGFCIAILDVDKFKAINDTYGHLAGDQVLKSLAIHASAFFRRGTDVLTRIGGDEFILLMSETAYTEASRLLREFHKKVKDIKVPTTRGFVNYTMSVGFVSVPIIPDNLNLYQLIFHADRLLYEAKKIRNSIEGEELDVKEI